MKTILLPLLLPLFILGIFVTDIPYQNTQSPGDTKTAITICGGLPGGNIQTAENGKFIVPLPGWGNYSYPISTQKDSARFYFNQGLTMYYSYHMKESLASFKEASRFDPASAMTYWGQALAMGPSYNAAHSYVMPAAIQEVLQRMNNAKASATEKEKHLIAAMNKRYSSDATDANRKDLNLSYASEMKGLMSLHPDDQDIKTLYVDAVMVIHAWDFWNNDGSPKEWTPELVTICEEVLKTNPLHPAALHYHIHVTEASRHPEVALPNADKLKTLLPGVPHMVHMASHEYERNGLFGKGVEVNDLADTNLMIYDSLASHLALVKHSPHYFAVQTYCAMSGGMYKTGMKDALRCRKSVSPNAENWYDQYLYMMPVLTMARLGKWEEILKDPVSPDPKWTYAALLHNFARGLAYVNIGNLNAAKNQLLELQGKLKEPILTKRRIPFNAALPVAKIAEGILEAAILFDQRSYDAAISRLYKAIEIEDGLIYTEPNDWPIPARQFLGAYLLKTGNAPLAEKIYLEDLMWNPANGWSRLGLYQSLLAEQKTQDLTLHQRKYRESFSHTDVVPTGSVFMK